MFRHLCFYSRFGREICSFSSGVARRIDGWMAWPASFGFPCWQLYCSFRTREVWWNSEILPLSALPICSSVIFISDEDRLKDIFSKRDNQSDPLFLPVKVRTRDKKDLSKIWRRKEEKGRSYDKKSKWEDRVNNGTKWKLDCWIDLETKDLLFSIKGKIDPRTLLQRTIQMKNSYDPPQMIIFDLSFPSMAKILGRREKCSEVTRKNLVVFPATIFDRVRLFLRKKVYFAAKKDWNREIVAS